MLGGLRAAKTERCSEGVEEQLGSEDEENNSYSLGGDRHEDLEEDRS